MFDNYNIQALYIAYIGVKELADGLNFSILNKKNADFLKNTIC